MTGAADGGETTAPRSISGPRNANFGRKLQQVASFGSVYATG
jgi:hypothetical protein